MSKLKELNVLGEGKYHDGPVDGHLFYTKEGEMVINKNYLKGKYVKNINTDQIGEVMGCYWGNKELEVYPKFTVNNVNTGKTSNWKVDNTIIL